MSKTRNEGLTVEALGREENFADIAELGVFVEQIVATSGMIFGPLEIACIARLVADAPDEASEAVHRISRAMVFHGPSRPPKIATPFDAKLVDADQRVEATEAARHAALDARRALEEEFQKRILAAGKDDNARSAVQGWAAVASPAAEQAVQLARDEAGRALARRNALSGAASRFRSDDAVRLYDPDNPSKPLTIAEFAERRGK